MFLRLFRQMNARLANHSLSALEAICDDSRAMLIGKYVVSNFELFTTFSDRALSKTLDIGWKAHISVSREQLALSYPLIVSLLQAANVLEFKITNLKKWETCLKEAVQKNEPGNRRLYDGMQWTIYMDAGEECKLNHLFIDIEEILKKNNISPGVIDVSDRALGEFISVRHQGSTEYRSSQSVDSYNPENVQDPFTDLVVLKLKVDTERARLR